MFKLCRVYLVFGVLFVGFLNSGEATHVSQAEWDNYKATFNKSYTNGQRSETYARYYYAQNKKAIDAHNSLYDRGQRSYRLKVNQFTDMRSKHFMQLFPPTRQPIQSNASPLPPPSPQTQPITFDPRLELGLNVTVQDQGTVCNSGWAYATAKSVEVLQAFQIGNLRPATRSAQNLIDCAGSVNACRNQVPQTAFDYLTVHNMDLLLESDYRNDKSAEQPNMCVPSGDLVTNLRAYARIPDGQDNTLRTYLANNYPAVFEFNPNSFEFMHYSDGVFTPEHSRKQKQGSHYMTAIGYGTDVATKLDYWLVLNSWGQTWGEDGYIRIARNSNSPLAKSTLLPTEMAKMCKIASAVHLLLLIATTLLCRSSLALDSFPKLTNVKNFDDYLAQTGKSYPNAKEREFREALFLAKKTIMDLVNQQAAAGLSTFKLALNPLADVTHIEVARMTGSKISFTGEDIISRHTNYVTTELNPNTLPESFDWRQKGGVSPVRFQGFECGSCWSFATIGSLEGHMFRRTGQLVPLSEQDLVDCAERYGSMGCDGGFQEYAFEYIRDNGVSLAHKYPYKQMENPQCIHNQTGAGIYIRDYARIKPGDEDKMKEVIATLGPLACSMNANTISFAQYEEGIYDDDECNKEEVNHSVVVVGYGSENGKDYWIIKNSYSENWGDNGFIKLARNKNSFCGIANECSYPLL